MRIIVTDTYEEMSDMAINYLMAQMIKNHRVNLAITAGSTPIRMYEKLVPLVKDKRYFDNVHYYNFDEIPFNNSDREGVTISNLRKYYYSKANIKEEQIHKLTIDNYQHYDEMIKQDGGLDLLILGLGYDGHFCGNSPRKTKWDNLTVKLPIFKEHFQSIANSEFDGELAAVPDYFVTMGPRSVMMARQLVMIVNGKHKASMVKRVIEGEIDEMIPATILKLHPDLTIIMDQDAASELDPATLEEWR